MRPELKAAIDAVKCGAKITMKRYGELIPFEMKGDNTPVTKIDKKCETEMLKIIRKLFPSDAILSEESGKIGNLHLRRWIIDPIDGTKAFIHTIPTFGNMVAFEEDGELVAGAISVPAMGKLIYAEKDGGAFNNGKRIRVSKVRKLSDASILHGRGKGFLEKGYLKKLRKLLDAVYHSWGFNDPFAFYLLASGKVDAIVETFPHPWDVAAPNLIVQEAGGKFTDLSGRNTLYSNTLAIYSNGLLHDALIDILRKD